MTVKLEELLESIIGKLASSGKAVRTFSDSIARASVVDQAAKVAEIHSVTWSHLHGGCPRVHVV